MALFKCKMCGGDLEIAEGVTIAECEYCGTKQTVPKAMDENLQNLFNRANTLRIKSEFDKAEKLYEKIIQADTTQSEAYWGLILCKYGIEYVDDPATFKKIPTCHRASYDSIIADDDYKSAIENADLSQRAIYEEQAKEIDRIQKDILALAQKEETYDVFICYKETDADGRRTQDSVIANDIYYQLTQEGFKVFYAAITLEGKLGSAYEPIIFAALNSAKVMLSIGTKPEYFNAVWVKNEWSRFLKIIKKDRSKLLIPCYRDMDAYELPEEFAHLQAQDMAKIGFINDLVRGIKKVVEKDEPKQSTVVKETVVSGTNSTIAPLLKRAFMFLEDGDWNSADEYCEKVLDIDPENAQAYLGKLMAELNVKKQDKLKDQADPFDDSNNYQKAIRFADEKLRDALTGYIEHINTRNENARLEGIYNKATSAMSSANSSTEYEDASNIFKTILNYKDSEILVAKCLECAEKARIEEKEKAETSRKNSIYNGAIALMNKPARFVNKFSTTHYEEAIKEFQKISGWRDSDEKIIVCQKKIEELKAQAEADRLEKARFAEIGRIEAEKRAKRNKKIAIITIPIVCAIIAFIIVLNTVIIPNGKYNDAIALMDAGKYSEAISAFEALDGYKDSAIKIVECNIGLKYNDAIAAMEKESYHEAIHLFESLDGYKDSIAKIAECETALLDGRYNDALIVMNAGRYDDAIILFEALNGHRDSIQKIDECKSKIYDIAIDYMNAGRYNDAIITFESIDGYKDATKKISECNTIILDGKYNDAMTLMEAGRFFDAYNAFVALSGHKDSDDKADSIYQEHKWKIDLGMSKKGDSVFFGEFEQDNNYDNGKENIEWIVLEVQDGRVLLVSKYALDVQPYHNGYQAGYYNATWETCTLRKWLNGEFINSAFSFNEKAMIPTVTVETDDCNATQDQVFLLSTSEAYTYFNKNKNRICYPTEYAIANGADSNYGYNDDGCLWWLRNNGDSGKDYASVVLSSGSIKYSGNLVSGSSRHTVRPALWIDLNS